MAEGERCFAFGHCQTVPPPHHLGLWPKQHPSSPVFGTGCVLAKSQLVFTAPSVAMEGLQQNWQWDLFPM